MVLWCWGLLLVFWFVYVELVYWSACGCCEVWFCGFLWASVEWIVGVRFSDCGVDIGLFGVCLCWVVGLYHGGVCWCVDGGCIDAFLGYIVVIGCAELCDVVVSCGCLWFGCSVWGFVCALVLSLFVGFLIFCMVFLCLRVRCLFEWFSVLLLSRWCRWYVGLLGRLLGAWFEFLLFIGVSSLGFAFWVFRMV